jgi:hypothetical protein
MAMDKDKNVPAKARLRGIAIVLYATLALLWLAIPQSVSSWTRETMPAFVQPYATGIAESVEAIARMSGLPALYDYAREFFLLVVKK